jgi:acetylornithine/succinyldiaminopimelate/putrescine aminotransferase
LNFGTKIYEFASKVFIYSGGAEALDFGTKISEFASRIFVYCGRAAT